MPELFIELFSEEIPARMQPGGAATLERLIAEALAALNPRAMETAYGPRRIALKAEIDSRVRATSGIERGPRANAPEQALAGFLRKHDAVREQLRQEGDYWVLDKSTGETPAAGLIAAAMPPLLRRFPWPKSMRWGAGSQFAWVRPLRRIACTLDGEVVRFDLADEQDSGHGLRSDNHTEGHRFHSPGAFHVFSYADWRTKLRDHGVVADAEERKRLIAEGIAALAERETLSVVEDLGLLDEVAGLVEWPVPMLGRIDAAHMDLPIEVMQVSMRVNQRYFTLRTRDGKAAPWFAFVANIQPTDGGKAIVAGNERVLRARFADARHFWDLDRRTPLANRVGALDRVTFHAKLGTQGERARRLERLAGEMAPHVGADPALARRAARLAKADLLSGMVGEFPELQGVMGRYYALHDGEPPAAADAVRDHYAPKGSADAAPAEPVSIAVALADKLDQLAGFFAIGEKPSGSGDPFALRRAALGIIRIIRENNLRLRLVPLITAAGETLRAQGIEPAPPAEILEFLAERLRIQLRGDGARHDVLSAVFAAGADDDLNRLLARAGAVAALLGTDDGANLLTAYRRATNIIRIEERKDGPFNAAPVASLLIAPEEKSVARRLSDIEPAIARHLVSEDYAAAMSDMASLRAPLDAFFDKVTVNSKEADLRRNRLCLLAQVRSAMDRIADFSKIEA